MLLFWITAITAAHEGVCRAGETCKQDLRCVPLEDQGYGAQCTPDITSLLAAPDKFADQLKVAFDRHHMLIWKGESITPQMEEDFMKMGFPWDSTAAEDRLHGPFGVSGGDKERYLRWRLPEHTSILCQGEGSVREHHGLTGELSSGKPVKEWHTDGLYELDTPPAATSMYSVSIKPKGGDTLFMSGRLIYDSLPPDIKARCDGMTAHYRRVPRPMHGSGYRTEASGSSLGVLYEGMEGTAEGNHTSTVHPVVWVHPSTGVKALMLSPMWLHHLEDASGEAMSEEESQAFMHGLLRRGAPSELRHHWSVGDFVVWDNRVLYHSATPNSAFSAEGLRLLHRIRLTGADRPVGPSGFVGRMA